MEAQVDPHNTTGMHSGEEGEQQHHHKSVLKKVKEKAKKIKNTITKHGHAHDHDDDDEDDDEETVNDHEVHGAPMCESTVIRSVNLPKESNTNLEKPTDTREDRHDDNARNRGINTPFAPKEQTSPQMGLMDSRNVGEKAKIEPLSGLEEDPHRTKNRPSSENITPSNYQSKVADPKRAGSKEEEDAPLVRRFENLNVGDEPTSKKTEPEQRSYTGSHDQFAPQPTPTKSQFNPESTNQETNPTSAEPSTISGIISSTTSAIADKALSAKNVVASKLGYGGAAAADSDKKPVSESATEYAHMVAEKLTPVYQKVAGAGSAVMSKVHGGGEGTGEAHRGGDAVGVPVKGGATSMSEYLADKLRPGDEDKALSEAITGAFSKNKGEGRPWGGKVTVSKEVADRLGPVEESKREGEDAVAAGLESSGQGVVDRLRDAVGLWLGKSTGMQTAQDSVSKSHVSGVGAGTGQDFSGEKRD